MDITNCQFIKVSLDCSAKRIEAPSGTYVKDVLPDKDEKTGLPYIGALVNNDAVSLMSSLDTNCSIRGLTIAEQDGWIILRRSMCFLLAMTAHKLFPEAKFRIHYSVESGIFFSLTKDKKTIIDEAAVKNLENEMHSITKKNFPIIQSSYAYEDAVLLFTQTGMQDKLGLLCHTNSPSIQIVTCCNFADIFQGPLASRTGLLELFNFVPYEGGCVLQFSKKSCREEIPPFHPQPALMKIFKEHIQWGEFLGVSDVGQLNKAVFDLGISDIIQMSEALHDKNFAETARKIVSRDPLPQIVLIAGPSSAGKTTSAKRLSIHLRVNGLNPVIISTDDYFVGDEQNPRDEEGNLDYEHLEAVDREAFNQHLNALLEGKTIKRRTFDFKAKSPVITGEDLKLDKNGILIVEGIHGLNPLLTSHIPRRNKFLIYLSALTQLSIDNNNLLSTSDNRLIRRIVRDHLFRNHSALQTIRLWPSVRRGEERWIFPYQDESDAALNTALDYELAVLRLFAEPLLTEIKPDHKEYATVRRLQRILKNFHPIPPSAVPRDSILREYIGGSYLKY